MPLDFNYPKKDIPGNPYKGCSFCGKTDPEINGELTNHSEWCEYRIKREQEQKVNLLETEIDLLKYERNNIYAVVAGWSEEGAGWGEDISTLRLFTALADAESYQKDLEADPNYNPSINYTVLLNTKIQP